MPDEGKCDEGVKLNQNPVSWQRPSLLHYATSMNIGEKVPLQSTKLSLIFPGTTRSLFHDKDFTLEKERKF